MSWQDVTPVNARTALGMVNYSYSPKLGARVTLPASVGAALKWKAGQLIRLQVGGGEHAGMLRLVADGNGPLSVRTCKTTALQVHIGKLDALPAREVKRCTVRHEAEASALTITLPPHAQAIAPPARPAATGGGLVFRHGRPAAQAARRRRREGRRRRQGRRRHEVAAALRGGQRHAAVTMRPAGWEIGPA